MTLLSYTEICELIEQGVIENAKYENVNSSSLDITLGEEILVESTYYTTDSIQVKNTWIKQLDKKHHLNSVKCKLETSYSLRPNEFILAHSVEIFHLPLHISAEYKLKSSMARLGLEHLNAGWCDAGWNNSVLTLELKNVTRHHSIVLTPGDKIGQIVFFKHTPVPEDKSYKARGSYNGDKTE